MNKEKNVFISHFNKDDEHIQYLKDLLEKKGYIIKNSSIESTKPNRIINDDIIRRLLRMRISWAGTFICLVGTETHKRPWVDWEIEQAHRKGKKIIGVYVYGAREDAVIPKNLEKYGHGLTGWNSDKIIDAIEGQSIGWSIPDGSPRISSSHLVRVGCQ